MRKPDIHPLDDPNITWLRPQDVERIKYGQVDKAQQEREHNYNRKQEQTPSWLLEDKETKQ